MTTPSSKRRVRRKAKRSPERRGKASAGPQPLADLVDLASRIHFQIGSAAERLYGKSAHGSGRRAVLGRLVEVGPQAVARLAQMSRVSPAIIERIVRELRREEMVAMITDPEQRRSRLVQITARGRRSLKTMLKRDEVARQALVAGVGVDEIARAVRTLRQVAEEIDALLAQTERSRGND